MSSDSLFVLAVALITLGGVFFYLLRVEALAKKLESQVRDTELEVPIQTLSDDQAPLPAALETGAAPHKLSGR